MREERMYKNESPKISNAQINSQSLSHDDFIVWLFVKSPWQRHSPQLTKMYFFLNHPLLSCASLWSPAHLRPTATLDSTQLIKIKWRYLRTEFP